MSGALLNNGAPLVYNNTLLLTIGGGSGGGGGSSGIALVDILGHGQSNANYADNVDGALAAKAQAVAFYLGAASYAGVSNSTTDQSGVGSYPPAVESGYTFYLNYNGGDTTAEAGSATASSAGSSVISYLSGLTTNQKTAILSINVYWLETDSVFLVNSAKASCVAGLVNWFGQLRTALGKTAAQLPVIIFAPPYSTTSAAATVREVMALLQANSANNVVWAVPQTFDTISRNESWNATTGVASGGNTDGGHRSAIDNVMLYKRSALATARAILSSNGLAASLIPSSLGNGIGPKISNAALSGTTLTLTIAHDGGNDLIVPLLAAQGVGFALMDGGSVASPGNLIKATACTRVDATHLSVTLASAPSNAHTSCSLFYPWPGEVFTAQPDCEIGRGCAVTDNFSTVSKPSGFDMNASIGSGWQANNPLCFPMRVTGSGGSATATAGIALSS